MFKLSTRSKVLWGCTAASGAVYATATIVDKTYDRLAYEIPATVNETVQYALDSAPTAVEAADAVELVQA